MEVITCLGPTHNPTCPMLSGRPCRLADDADVIVVRNAPADDANWRAVVTGHADVHGDVPVVAEHSQEPGANASIDDVRVPAFLHHCLQASSPARVVDDAL
jgi:hypothetical protein